MSSVRTLLSLALVAGAVACSGGKPAGVGRHWHPRPVAGVVIRLTGSDTMVNLDQAWAENYKTVEAGRVGAGGRRRVRRGHRRPHRRHPRHRRVQPRDGARRNRARHEVGGQRRRRNSSSGSMRWRCTCTTATRSRRSRSRSWREIYGDGGKLTKWSQLGMQEPGVRLRRDHPRQPAEQLRHLRLLPRGRARPHSASSSWARSTRAARRTWSRWSPARRAPSATAAWPTSSPGVRALAIAKKKGETADRADARDGPGRHLSDLRGRSTSTRTATPTAAGEGVHRLDAERRRARRSCRTSATCRRPRQSKYEGSDGDAGHALDAARRRSPSRSSSGRSACAGGARSSSSSPSSSSSSAKARRSSSASSTSSSSSPA